MNIKEITNEVEKVSQSYAEKFDINRDSDWFILKLQEELGELIQCYLIMEGQARKKQKSPADLRSDFEDEVADVFCHILLLAKHHNVEIEQKASDKWLKWSTKTSLKTKN